MKLRRIRLSFLLIGSLAGTVEAGPLDVCGRTLGPLFHQIANAPKAALQTYISTLERLAEFKSEAFKEWNLNPEWDAKFNELFSDPHLSDEEKLQQFYSMLLEARIEKTPRLSQWLIRSTAQNVLNDRSIYSKIVGRMTGAHYNPLINSIHLSNKLDPLRDPLIAMHEAEHAVERNTNPLMLLVAAQARAWDYSSLFIRSPLTPIAVNRIERRAIGAQWEMARRIPKDKREYLIKQFYDPSWNARLKKYNDRYIKMLLDTGLFKYGYDLLKKVYPSSSGLNPESIAWVFDTLHDAYDKDQKQLVLDEIHKSQSISEAEKQFLNRFINKSILSDEKIHRVYSMDELQALAQDEVEALRRQAADLNLDQVTQAYMNANFLTHGPYKMPEAVSLNKEQKQILSTLKSNRDSVLGVQRSNYEVLLNKIFIESLRNADLSKEEFIRVMETVHGYNVSNNLTRGFGWNLLLLPELLTYSRSMLEYAQGHLAAFPNTTIHELQLLAEIYKILLSLGH